ncbi:ATP-dependent DNA helicase [Bifidobacterium cuniculi]|uniref:DNA 3'-5' helicase n=1 Tax=Bifidobacterium cuniculi TaxID=1688 RepID=A0A087B524_9BIFI|nr:ATP-dependent DNA helicase [Bifidobacterium cuniculi]KFI66124.1 ATP-dependent DNA helicase [Bifidobacterium cuniculi]
MAKTPTPSAEQRAIIEADAGADVLVVAGAGSGKTFTMTRRIIQLIADGVAPERILGLTFTRKAAAELLSRVSGAVAAQRGDAAGAFMKPDVLTYDAFFQSIVRQYGLLVGFDQQVQPLSAAGAAQLAADVVGANLRLLVDSELDMGSFGTVVSQVLALSEHIANSMIGPGCEDMEQAIARIRAWDARFAARIDAMLDGIEVPDEKPAAPRNFAPPKYNKNGTMNARDAKRMAAIEEYERLMPAWDVAAMRDAVRRRELLLDLVARFQEEKHARHMAEFSDFTVAAYQLVTRFPSIGARYRRRYTHVLLDEYQDTSTTQAALLARLFHVGAGERSAVNAVGDPFQSIYAWRGASPGAFTMFKRDFAMDGDAKPYPITATRRNARVILDAANDLTQVLRRRPPRPTSARLSEVDVDPLSMAPDSREEGTLGVLGYDTQGQEVDGVVRFIAKAVHDARKAGEGAAGKPPYAAVLFRSKKSMGDYQDALEQAGMSTCAVGISALVERPEIIDTLAVLRVVADHADTAALLRLLATPRYGVGVQDLAALARLADRLNTEYRYRALLEAGVADDPDADLAAQRQAVRDHSRQVPNAVFVADVLLDDDLDGLMRNTAISPQGRHGIARAARVLRLVQHAAYQPLGQVARAAVEALGLDIDMMLATALHRADGTADPAIVRAPMEALAATVDTYVQEIATAQAPTLRGYLAWMARMGDIEETQPVSPDTPVDVMLMTVHQAKGLEWNVVAIPALRAGIFPSNTGDKLSVEAVDRDRDQAFGADGSWHAPDYREEADTWLTDPTAVPAPIRIDADILPRFPHDAPAGADPIEALDVLDDPMALDDEVSGTLRDLMLARGDADQADADSWDLTQREEYGRRLHADERRLMYVALTRARHAALLTTSRRNALVRNPLDERIASRSTSTSNFWSEVEEAMSHEATLARVPSNVQPAAEPTGEGDTLAALGADLPQGFFVGDDAQDWLDAVVGDAWNATLDDPDDQGRLPWPFALSGPLRARLRRSVDAVTAAIDDGALPATAAGPLSAHAALIADDTDLGPLPGMDEHGVDAMLRERAARILSGQRLNATTLQANASAAGEHGARRQRDIIRGILRPIPQLSSPAALDGTRLHAWAERYLTAGQPGSPTTRAAMAADAERELADAHGRQERRLATWKARLIDSPWAARRLASAEQSIVAAIDGIPNLVQGKLDAVFAGGLDDPDDAGRLTIVDWKTGRRPRTPEEKADKLRQLDFYRLLLARERDMPLDRIDAALYYVSEADPALRQVNADAKDEERIMEELKAGIPQVDDED